MLIEFALGERRRLTDSISSIAHIGAAVVEDVLSFTILQLPQARPRDHPSWCGRSLCRIVMNTDSTIHLLVAIRVLVNAVWFTNQARSHLT